MNPDLRPAESLTLRIKSAPKPKMRMHGLKHKTLAQERAYIRLAMRGAKQRHPIYEAVDLIKLALERHERNKISVSWSGGRCSTVVLHMALQIFPDIKVFHCNHGVHYPEIVQFVKRVTREWNLNLTIYEPEKTFWQCVDEYGFPEPRRPADPDGRRPSIREPKCCKWLKHKPLTKFIRAEGIEAHITGLRVAEARDRMLSTFKVGQFHLHKMLKSWRYNPIIFWTTQQLIDYCAENSVPICSIYERTDRSGCWPCTAYVGWKESLMRTNLKFYNFLMKKMGEKGEQVVLDHFYRAHVEPPCHTERGIYA